MNQAPLAVAFVWSIPKERKTLATKLSVGANNEPMTPLVETEASSCTINLSIDQDGDLLDNLETPCWPEDDFEEAPKTSLWNSLLTVDYALILIMSCAPGIPHTVSQARYILVFLLSTISLWYAR